MLEVVMVCHHTESETPADPTDQLSALRDYVQNPEQQSQHSDEEEGKMI